MNLLIVTPAFYPATYYGGPIYSTYELAKSLKTNGTDVRVITTNANGNEKLEIKTGVFQKLDNELPVKYYKSVDSRGTSLSMLFNLRKDIKQSDLVYLISIFSPSTPLTIFLCRLFKKPLIISPRGQLGKWCLEQGNIFKKLWLRLFIAPFINFEPFDKLRAGSVEGQPYIKHFHWHLSSAAEEQDVIAVYPSAKSFVIPNGVSEELFSINDNSKDKTYYNKYTGIDCSNKKIIISMGRLHKVKGFEILINAMRNLQREDAVLLIAGEDFGERKNLEKLIDKLGLKEKVFLVGNIEGEDKKEFLRNADLFALASHHENFGMVYAEALASGTPVVASTNTPWQDVEKHNCGMWVENNPAEFAEAINKVLISDPEQMGKNGRKFIKENFSWEKITREFLRMFKALTLEKHD